MTINNSAIPEQGMCEEKQIAWIVWFYYHDGLTQSEISDRLSLTRLKVSRLLEKGHRSGIIRVQISSRLEGCLGYETQLHRQLSLQHVRVILGLTDTNVSGWLGIDTAYMLMSLLQPQQMLAIGFGETTMSTLQHLSGFISSQQIRLVTLSGGVGSYMTGIGQLNATCSVDIIPTPLRASSADITRALKNEDYVRDVLLATQVVDVMTAGIGAVSQQDDATIIRSGYISQGEQLMIGRKGAVDGILGYFFDTKGDVITDIKIHNKLTGLPSSSLKTIPIQVGVAGGENKVEAIAAVMKGDYTDALVTDQDAVTATLRSQICMALLPGIVENVQRNRQNA